MTRTVTASYFRKSLTVTLYAPDKRDFVKRAAAVLEGAAARWGVSVSALEYAVINNAPAGAAR